MLTNDTEPYIKIESKENNIDPTKFDKVVEIFKDAGYRKVVDVEDDNQNDRVNVGILLQPSTIIGNDKKGRVMSIVESIVDYWETYVTIKPVQM